MTPAVTISASFRAGSMFDPPGLEGLSYLTGRTIDRGTEHRNAGQIAQALDDLGVSLKVSHQPACDDAVVHLPDGGLRQRARRDRGRVAASDVPARTRLPSAASRP